MWSKREVKVVKFLGFIFLSLLILFLFGVGCKSCLENDLKETSYFKGVVKQKIFIPAARSSGYGMSTSGKMVFTTSSESKKYILIVAVNNNNYELETSKSFYYSCNVGDSVGLKHSPLFGVRLNWLM